MFYNCGNEAGVGVAPSENNKEVSERVDLISGLLSDLGEFRGGFWWRRDVRFPTLNFLFPVNNRH
jgi:hypothetical protein